jgi:hemerythrin superfamily protein
MDAIALLKQDHATIKTLFKRYQALAHDGDAGKKQELSRRIIEELSIHAAIEEQVFYPSVKAHDSRWAAQIDKALEEHKVAKWELAALQKMVPDDARFDAKFAVLVQNVLYHIEEEETELFASLHRTFAREELDALADALLLAKRAVPTHPHPRLPDEPPGNMVVAPLVAVFDRSRDLLTAVVERGAAWAQDAGRRFRERTEQFIEVGRGRALEVGAEAQRWSLEGPGRALKVSSDVLEETRQAARGATRRARRMAGQAASDAATLMGNGAPRQKASSSRRSTASQARRVQGSVSLRTSATAGRTARKRSTSGAGRSAGKSAR